MAWTTSHPSATGSELAEVDWFFVVGFAMTLLAILL